VHVRNKRGTEWTGGETAHTQAQGLLWRSGAAEGVPRNRAGATATYRLGVDKGGGAEVSERSLG
jgi:hypothetical protein